MKKYFAAFSLLNFAITFTYAQAPSVEVWDKRFGGIGQEGCHIIHSINDNGIIIGAGSTSNISGDISQPNRDTTLSTIDYWIVKVDSSGNKQWDRRFGGMSDDVPTDLVLTANNSYVIAGISASGISGDKSQFCWGGSDYWAIKIDSSGNKQWDRRFGGTLNEDFASIDNAKDGGYIIGGSSNSPISGDKSQPDWDSTNFDDDYWVVKIDSNGNKQWDKRFGGIQEDVLVSVKQTIDGAYILAGTTHSGQDGDISDTSFGGSDFWVVKIDSLGNKLWDKRYGGQGNDECYSMAATFDGGFILGGISGGPPSGNKTSTGCGYEDYWVVKIDSNGNELWDKDYGGLNGDDLRSVVQTKDKGYLIAGYSNSVPSCDKSEINLSLFQTWVVKVDSLGNKEWDKTIFTIGSGELDGYAIETCDGCYVIANGTRAGIGGYKTQPNWDLSDATYDVWLVKFCFTGTPEGINQLSQQARIKVFPAPFTQDLNVNIQQPGLKQATISICNILGQAVYTNTETNLSPNYTKMLDLRYLPNGIYFVKVEVDGAVEVKEVVKE